MAETATPTTDASGEQPSHISTSRPASPAAAGNMGESFKNDVKPPCDEWCSRRQKIAPLEEDQTAEAKQLKEGKSSPTALLERTDLDSPFSDFYSTMDPITHQRLFIHKPTNTQSDHHPRHVLYLEPYDPDLPFPYERLYDSSGREFFKNHATGTTTRLNPVIKAALIKRGIIPKDEEQQPRPKYWDPENPGYGQWRFMRRTYPIGRFVPIYVVDYLRDAAEWVFGSEEWEMHAWKPEPGDAHIWKQIATNDASRAEK